MSSSLFEGLVQSEDARWTEYAPVDTAWARALGSNAAHLADESAQVVANWRVANLPIVRDEDASENRLGAPTRPYMIWASQPFHLRFRPDGTSYRVRVRVRAAAANGLSAAIRVFLAGRGTTLGASATGDTRSLVYTFSSATPAWLTSPLHGDGNGNVYIPTAAECFVDRATIESLGGSATVVRYTEAVIRVYGVPTGGGTGDRIQLYGVHAAEYVGT